MPQRTVQPIEVRDDDPTEADLALENQFQNFDDDGSSCCCRCRFRCLFH